MPLEKQSIQHPIADLIALVAKINEALFARLLRGTSESLIAPQDKVIKRGKKKKKPQISLAAKLSTNIE